jgi:F-box domain
LISSYSALPYDYNTIDHYLPNEIIIKILSYLSITDLINLSIAKLFCWSLFKMPWFLDKLNYYLTHSLCQYFLTRNNIYTFCSVIPLIIDDTFYFAIDITRLNFLNRITCTPYNITWTPLQIYSSVFHSYNTYLRSPNKKELHIFTQNIPECHLLCECYLFYYQKIHTILHVSIFKRNCCMSDNICLLE